MDKFTYNSILSGIGDIGLRQRVDFIVPTIPFEENLRVLDLGCGESLYTFTLLTCGFPGEIVAFDFNAELLLKARKWVSSYQKVEYKNGDITAPLPFEDKVFDIIIFTEVLEHLDDDITPMLEINRVLKDNGKVLLTVPNINFPLRWDPINKIRMACGLGHFSRYNTVLGGVWSYDHKRLYDFKRLENITSSANLFFCKRVSLTHHCLVFNYLILRIGKLIGQLFPDSGYARAIEKFNLESYQKTSFSSFFVSFVFRWVEKYYILNKESEYDLNQSSVSIGGVLEKSNGK